MVLEVPLDAGWGTRFHRYHVLDGRAPRADAPHEVAINRRLADLLEVGVGDRIVVELYAPDQIDVVANGGLPPVQETQAVTLTVTGIELRPGDLEAQPAAQAGTIEEFNQAHIAFTPAFWPSLDEQEVALYGIGTGVDLTGAPGARAGFASAARELGLTVEDDSPVEDRDALERSTRIEAIALYVLAGIVAVAGAVLIGSALRATSRSIGPIGPRCGPSGCGRSEMAEAEVFRAAPILLGGAAVGLVVAVVGSPLLAFGTSGQADPDPGVHFSGPVVLLALVTALLVTVGGDLPLRAPRPRRRAPRAAGPARAGPAGGRAGRVGRGAALDGGRSADGDAEPGAARAGRPAPRSSRSPPAWRCWWGWSPSGGACAGLITTPELRGWTWDVEVGNFSNAATTRGGPPASWPPTRMSSWPPGTRTRSSTSTGGRSRWWASSGPPQSASRCSRAGCPPGAARSR